MRTQTDNRSLRDKVRLRHDICARLGEPLRVLDLFAGEGWIWKKMGETFPIAAYTPVDIRPRQPGCIRLDVNARTIHAFNPNQFNVIDIDTYGEPWAIWGGLAPRIQRRLAVFLTCGVLGRSGNSFSNFLRRFAGIPEDWNAPSNDELLRFVGRGYLVSTLEHLQVEQALYIEHRRGGGWGKAHAAGVDYYALLVSPRK